MHQSIYLNALELLGLLSLAGLAGLTVGIALEAGYYRLRRKDEGRSRTEIPVQADDAASDTAAPTAPEE